MQPRATSAHEQSALILGAGCWPATDAVRRATVRKVSSGLLCEIRKEHPTYRRYFHNAPLESLRKEHPTYRRYFHNAPLESLSYYDPV